MLSTRTKQVNSYGKRHRRIVDITTEHTQSVPKEIVSIFDNMPPPPAWAPLASKMKKRGDSAPKLKAASPKIVGLRRKKRLSPVLSPVKKTNRVAQPPEMARKTPANAISQLTRPTAKPLTSGKKDDSIEAPTSLPRVPLSAYPINVFMSPALRSKHRAGDEGLLPWKGTPSKLSKPFSPYHDIDIIVLNDDGQTITKERRVSRNNVETSHINAPKPKAISSPHNPPAPIYVDSEGESEIVDQPKRHKRLMRRQDAVVVSEDSASDTDRSPVPSPVQKESMKPGPVGSNVGKKQSFEIVIPPAPYPLYSSQVAKVSTMSPIPQATTPPTYFPHRKTHRPLASFPLAPSPIPKARQLTPIRGMCGGRGFEPPSPLSPSTLSDLDLSLDFSELNLGLPLDVDMMYGTDQHLPEYLKPLLEECHQETCGPLEFSAFIDTFPFDPILQTSRNRGNADLKFWKIGEASYSEVFGIGDVVLKVIPLRDESRPSNTGSRTHGKLTSTWDNQIVTDQESDGPAPSDATDVQKEIVVTRAMGEVYSGFVKLLKTYVVKGRYPEVLLNLWDDYNERKGSESVRPDTFTLSQTYAIIVLPNGGPDLEAYTFCNASKTGWKQACSIFWQIAKALTHAEQLVSFEHRDLHWGQILVKNVHPAKPPLSSLNMNQRSKPQVRRSLMDDLEHGVQTTIIDLGLSRMDAGDGGNGGNVQWTPFDEEVFMGEGDYQFDVYRMMRNLTGCAWEGYHPMTNVMWLHYLTTKLLHSKGLKPPNVSRRKKGSPETASPSLDASFTENDCYNCLVDIDAWLGRCVAEAVPMKIKTAVKTKGRRKTAARNTTQEDGLACAGEIVEYGVKKGWISATILY